jgi:hypothetical protein
MSPVKLAGQTLLTILAMVIGMGAELFLPAWTLDYWQAWVFIVVVVGCSNAIGVYLALKDPALLVRRNRAGPTAENRPAQRIAQTLFILSLNPWMGDFERSSAGFGDPLGGVGLVAHG